MCGAVRRQYIFPSPSHEGRVVEGSKELENSAGRGGEGADWSTPAGGTNGSQMT